MDNAASLGQRLKALRKQKKPKLTQGDVAFFASDEGHDGFPTMSKIEHGKFRASRSMVSIYVLLALLSNEQIEQAKAIMEDLLQAPTT